MFTHASGEPFRDGPRQIPEKGLFVGAVLHRGILSRRIGAGPAGRLSSIENNAGPSHHLLKLNTTNSQLTSYDRSQSASPNSCRSRRSTLYLACRTEPALIPSCSATSAERRWWTEASQLPGAFFKFIPNVTDRPLHQGSKRVETCGALCFFRHDIQQAQMGIGSALGSRLLMRDR